MFWKKKQRPIELVSVTSTTKRENYRYTPADPADIPCVFRGRKILIHDISAGGISFENCSFSQGDSGDMEIWFEEPGLKKKGLLSVRINVLSIDEKGLCHCSFDNLDEDDQEVIHQYLLIKQKQEIQKKKRDSSH